MTWSNRRKLFEQWADEYDDIVNQGTGFPFEGYDRVLELVLRASQPLESSHVLDVGSGTGILASRIAGHGGAVTGVDFSPKMNAIAQRNLPNATFLEMDILSSWDSLGDRRFDRIVSTYVLHEFDLATKLTIIRNLIQHHLSRQGKMLVGDIAFPTANDRELARQDIGDYWDPNEHYWAADETDAALEESGIASSYQQVSQFAGVFCFVQH